MTTTDEKITKNPLQKCALGTQDRYTQTRGLLEIFRVHQHKQENGREGTTTRPKQGQKVCPKILLLNINQKEHEK
jgi:hypothetical protein